MKEQRDYLTKQIDAFKIALFDSELVKKQAEDRIKEISNKLQNCYGALETIDMIEKLNVQD